MNWGYRILTLYIGFILMISFLIYLCTGQRFDLVSENYYDQEIQYQQQVDRMKNVIDGDKKIAVTCMTDEAIELQFPISSENKNITGNIHFFKPDNADHDFLVKINPDEKNIQRISSDTLHSGKWQVKISWADNTMEYYQEENIYIK